jgi:hypothetical protein
MIPFVRDPTEAELAGNPQIAELVVVLKRAAIAWAERRELATEGRMALLRESLPDGTTLEWEVTDAVEHVFSGGITGSLPPDTPLGRIAAGYLYTMMGRRLAELVLEGTGLSASAIADAFEAYELSGTDAAHVGPPLVTVMEWLSVYLGGREAVASMLATLQVHFYYAFARIARAEAEERAASLEGELRSAPIRTLGRDVKFPQGLVRSGWEIGHFVQKADGLLQGELFPFTSRTSDAVQDAATVWLDRSQFGSISTDQVRALVAVFRIFTTVGDDGRLFREGPVTIDASLLYQGAGINSRSVEPRRRLFEALDWWDSHPVYLTTQQYGQRPDGTQGMMISGERTPLFTIKPWWFPSDDGRKKGRDDLGAIHRAWGRRGLTDHKPEWTGPLPDRYEIVLSDFVRAVGGSIVVDAEVLDRLDRGAKVARGATESFTALDWRLWMEVTLRVQSSEHHISQDGASLNSYVDRTALLVDYYGAEKVAHARRRGKLAKYIDQYERAAEVLVAGGLVQWIPDHVTGKGKARDIFIPSPELIRGLGARASRAARKIDKPAKTALAKRTP